MEILEYVTNPNFISFHVNKGKKYFTITMKAELNEEGSWVALDGHRVPYSIYIFDVLK